MNNSKCTANGQRMNAAKGCVHYYLPRLVLNEFRERKNRRYCQDIESFIGNTEEFFKFSFTFCKKNSHVNIFYIQDEYSRLPNKRPGTAIYFQKPFHSGSVYLVFKMDKFDHF